MISVELLVLSIAGTANSGSPAESAGLQPGIVRDEELARGVVRVINGFCSRVVVKGGLVFRWRRDIGQSGKRQDGEGAAVTLSGVGEVA